MLVLPFPVERVGRPLPDSVRVGCYRELSIWRVELLGRKRLLRRIAVASEAAARAEAARFVRTGLRLLPDVEGYAA